MTQLLHRCNSYPSPYLCNLADGVPFENEGVTYLIVTMFCKEAYCRAAYTDDQNRCEPSTNGEADNSIAK
jgi:hypothetical protein